jgi:dTDP-4-dehydrorhamnose 3,5-epimerase
MRVIKTELEGLLIIEPKVYEDERGYFYESFNENKYIEAGLDYKWVQDNQSKSSYGVVRGLHYQLEPYAQTKLVRVLQGRIIDIAVDIRKGSPSFGKWMKLELTEENKRQLLVPKGFAHGFAVISEIAVVLYKCDGFYNPQVERGIIYNDDTLDIDWGLNPDSIIVSDKDKLLPELNNAEMNFKYNPK